MVDGRAAPRGVYVVLVMEAERRKEGKKCNQGQKCLSRLLKPLCVEFHGPCQCGM